MLRLNHIKKSYETAVLSDFSYHFPETGLFVIRGVSGKGKTTLLRIIASLEKADEGTVEIKEGARISFVFQEARLVPHLSLLENVLLVGEKKDRERAEALLSRLKLLEAAHKKPSALSGGMKQRGAIARSLYYGSDIYLWDEPTAELDAENRANVYRMMEEVAKEALVICVTHDPELKSGTEITL